MNKILNSSLMIICLILLIPSDIYSQDKRSSKSIIFTIMGLGDSITAGSPMAPSYIFPLSEMLSQAGYMVDFIGPNQSTLENKMLNHAGFGGMNAEFLDAHINSIYREYPADIVLLHAGHNYFSENKPVGKNIKAQHSIIIKIMNINPNAIIFVAKVIESGKLPKYSYLSELNEEIILLVENLRCAGFEIYLVDQAASFNWRFDTIADMVHPNEQGAEKMAETWFRALNKYLKK